MSTIQFLDYIIRMMAIGGAITVLTISSVFWLISMPKSIFLVYGIKSWIIFISLSFFMCMLIIMALYPEDLIVYLPFNESISSMVIRIPTYLFGFYNGYYLFGKFEKNIFNQSR